MPGPAVVSLFEKSPLALPHAGLDNRRMINDSPKRLQFQFSMRTMVVVLVVGSMVLGVKVRMNQARTNRERMAADAKAVAEIEKRGKVSSVYKELRPRSWLEEYFDDPGGPDDPVAELDVREIYLWHSHPFFTGARFTDDELEHLKELKSLRYLDLSGTYITDDGLEHLKGLKNLRHLNLSGTQITDAGLEHLEGLTNLVHLDVSETQVTYAGLEHFESPKSLQVMLVPYPYETLSKNLDASN